MENNESAFEAEVQDETQTALLEEERRERRRGYGSNDQNKQPDVEVASASHDHDERSPLLGNSASSSQDSLDMTDTQRRITQPWTSGFEGLPWYKRPSIYWLLPAFFPFCMAFGGLLVPKVNLILSLICHDYFSDKAIHDPGFTMLPIMVGADNPQCQIPAVHKRFASFQLAISLCSGIFAALITPHMGALSDRIGRKKVITLAALGPFANEIITILVGTYPERISVWWLLLGAICDGLAGSFVAASAVCYSYAADCTSPERRNVAFGYFHGTLFCGMAFGPILSGWLIEYVGNIMVIFYVALGCHIFYILFLNVIVPESLSKERQEYAQEKHRAKMEKIDNSTWSSVVSNYNFFEPLSILWPVGPGSTKVIRRNMVFLATIDILCFGVAMGTMGIIIVYAERAFGWKNLEASAFISAANISRVASLLIFLPLVTRLVRGKESLRVTHDGANNLDLNIIRAALVFDLLGYIGYASALSGGVMVASGMIAAFGGMASPTLQSALTKHVPADRIGQLLGATGLLHAIARIVSPVIFNLIYIRSVDHFPGTVFVCLASVFVLAEILSWFLKPGVALPSDYEAPEQDPATRDRRYLIHRAGSMVFDGIRRMSTGNAPRHSSPSTR